MLVDVAKEHGLFIIGDEAYREFVYAGEPLQSMGQFADAAENVIVIDTVSKRFSACGARIGCLITRNRELMAHAMKYAQCRLSVPTLDQVAAAALYDVGPEYFAAVREEYKRRRDTVMQKLQAIPGVVCECPKGAFYVMAALPVDDADVFQRWLLEEFQDNGDTVMFAPGEPFYATPAGAAARSASPMCSSRRTWSGPWTCWPWASGPITQDKASRYAKSVAASRPTGWLVAALAIVAHGLCRSGIRTAPGMLGDRFLLLQSVLP